MLRKNCNKNNQLSSKGVASKKPMRTGTMEGEDVKQKTDALWIQYTDLMVETGIISEWIENGTCMARIKENPPSFPGNTRIR
jgi:hypothetical protein